ncbi:MAG: hypothetical protein ABW134_08265, partial [Candidatus Thiodiazotropha endolucinida]
FEKIPSARWLSIDYERFCENPAMVYGLIRDRLAQQDYAIPDRYMGQARFRNSNGSYSDAIKSLETVYSGIE